MLKDVMQHMEFLLLTRVGLLIFFACFIAIVIHALTRSRAQLDRWARLPLSADESQEERP
jgi:cbb3-type cytochrome oxidase subunit 3